MFWGEKLGGCSSSVGLDRLSGVTSQHGWSDFSRGIKGDPDVSRPRVRGLLGERRLLPADGQLQMSLVRQLWRQFRRYFRLDPTHQRIWSEFEICLWSLIASCGNYPQENGSCAVCVQMVTIYKAGFDNLALSSVKRLATWQSWRKYFLTWQFLYVYV